ncbi:hypothetical protein [Glycomyces harbinensis]|uniref:Uncharacterized protein n=1 Tax=Glycomyces harbinensis TaxID=58114 RepID=A0A1G7CGP9_9ACTN|nr:hypothetical protein [Glycomyces harbinensis]SDE37595.1 hypothetical protein SAMN05216270_119108 [Glycomyces harbinensis]
MRRAAAILLAGTLALTGCSDEPAEVTDGDVARIEGSLARGSELAWELTQAETRVAAMCMQDLGFTVHDRNLLHGMMIPNRFEGFASPYARIPTVEQAERFGFGHWVNATDTDAAQAMREDLDYLDFAGAELGWNDPAEHEEYVEWKDLGEEYQREWLIAFLGPERLAYQEALSHGQWDFDDLGFLPTHETVSRFYGGTGEALPEEIEPVEDPTAAEFAMALDFAECAEDAGLRDGAEEMWGRMYVEQLIDREAEVYVWEQEIEGYLANAQDHLAGD